MSASPPALRPEIAEVIATLVRSAEAGVVSLDALGEAVGDRAVSQDELERIVTALEAAGVGVAAPEGGGGRERLGAVLGAARALRARYGRTPRVSELAAASGLSEAHVREALFLATILQR